MRPLTCIPTEPVAACIPCVPAFPCDASSRMHPFPPCCTGNHRHFSGDASFVCIPPSTLYRQPSALLLRCILSYASRFIGNRRYSRRDAFFRMHPSPPAVLKTVGIVPACPSRCIPPHAFPPTRYTYACTSACIATHASHDRPARTTTDRTRLP
jgi:hypothetical protein